MSEAVFVDTSAWFAAVVPWDANHASAANWFKQNRRPLVTTDFVVDETLTLLRVKGENQRAITIGERLFAGQLALVHYLTPDDVLAAWGVFRQFGDKQWSFTDCTSYVVLNKLDCARALAFDDHFRQFGRVVVEP